MKTVTIEEYGVNTQYDVYTFGSGEPHITFTAGIHGNEVSGIYVAQRLIGHFIKNPPVKGTVKRRQCAACSAGARLMRLI